MELKIKDEKEIPDYVPEYTEEEKKRIEENFKENAREHLFFIQDMYKKQMESIPGRIAQRKSEIIRSLVFFVFIMGLCFLAITMTGIFSQWLIGAVACLAIIFWIYISVRDLIHAVLRYMVLTDKKIFSIPVRYKDIFTYNSEERYCREMIKRIDDELDRIEELTGDEIKKECSRLVGYPYEERRASFRSGNEDSKLV